MVSSEAIYHLDFKLTAPTQILDLGVKSVAQNAY